MLLLAIRVLDVIEALGAAFLASYGPPKRLLAASAAHAAGRAKPLDFNVQASAKREPVCIIRGLPGLSRRGSPIRPRSGRCPFGCSQESWQRLVGVFQVAPPGGSRSTSRLPRVPRRPRPSARSRSRSSRGSLLNSRTGAVRPEPHAQKGAARTCTRPRTQETLAFPARCPLAGGTGSLERCAETNPCRHRIRRKSAIGHDVPDIALFLARARLVMGFQLGFSHIATLHCTGRLRPPRPVGVHGPPRTLPIVIRDAESRKARDAAWNGGSRRTNFKSPGRGSRIRLTGGPGN